MKRSLLVLALTVALGISVGVNLWQFYNIASLNSELSRARVHLVTYDWGIVASDWEYQIVQVNFTLFNSGRSDAEFTLSIDLFDGAEQVESEEWEFRVNATRAETVSKRIYVLKLTDNCHIDSIEFYCPYFHNSSTQ